MLQALENGKDKLEQNIALVLTFMRSMGHKVPKTQQTSNKLSLPNAYVFVLRRNKHLMIVIVFHGFLFELPINRVGLRLIR